MKKTAYLFTFFLLLSTQFLMAQTEEPEEEEEPKEEVTKPSPPKPPSTPNIEEVLSEIEIYHQGAYIAKYEITYTYNNSKQKIETGSQTRGWKQNFIIPANSTNITLVGWAMTGLMWAPWGEIYNISIQPKSKGCYTNTGTTLNRNYKVGDCKDK